jgi:hypothetical protein
VHHIGFTTLKNNFVRHWLLLLWVGRVWDCICDCVWQNGPPTRIHAADHRYNDLRPRHVSPVLPHPMLDGAVGSNEDCSWLSCLELCHTRGLPLACNHRIAKVSVSILYLVRATPSVILGGCQWLLLYLVWLWHRCFYLLLCFLAKPLQCEVGSLAACVSDSGHHSGCLFLYVLYINCSIAVWRVKDESFVGLCETC